MATLLTGHSHGLERDAQIPQRSAKAGGSRVKILSEVVNNIRAVKLYAYEHYFGGKVSDIRHQEYARLRRKGLLQSMTDATFSFVPVLAAVCEWILANCALVTYHCCTVLMYLKLMDYSHSDLHHLQFDWSPTHAFDHLSRAPIVCSAPGTHRLFTINARQIRGYAFGTSCGFSACHPRDTRC